MKIRTQKARGIATLSSLHIYGIPRWVGVPANYHIMPFNIAPHYQFPLFARPCPLRPRHGFVESRKVSNLEELLDLWVKSKTEDPDAELVLMQPMTAVASAIATDAGVTWGLGNDGVTSAKGKQWDIPCPNANLTKMITRQNEAIKADIKDSVYIEIVEDEGKPTIVQLRDGPKLKKATGNYIPSPNYKVTNIIVMLNAGESSADLLIWEKKIAEAPLGSVIVIPSASLSSHYAVHGIMHKHAVLTGTWSEVMLGATSDKTRVKIGDVLQPDNDTPATLKKRDYKAMRLMTRKKFVVDKKEAPGFSTAVLHSMALWGREKHLLELRIRGAISMFKLLTAACAGEARHFASHRSGESAISWKELVGKSLSESAPQRKLVFEKALAWPLNKLVTLADQARQDLSGNWGQIGENETKFDEKGEIIPDTSNGRRGCSYGGPRWRRSAECALRLGNAIIKFQKTPNEQTWMQVASRYNEGVVCAHNGGRLLDKFCPLHEIDICAKCPQIGFMSSMAMQTILSQKGARKINETESEIELVENEVVGKIGGANFDSLGEKWMSWIGPSSSNSIIMSEGTT